LSTAFGKYSIIEKIGAGGMAEVFKCKRSGIGGFGKVVVVKRIRPELMEEQQFVDMFLDEARIAANLTHSNIIQIYEIDEMAGIPYISMEYVRGPTLARLAKEALKRDLREPVVMAKVVAGVCAALDYAHSAVGEDGLGLGIIHRDVSPQNILVSFEGVPKLLDFGVAKARGQIAHTTAGSLKGKVKFMAPELFTGEQNALTRRVDVFSAGVCLYYATTLRLPYEGDSEFAIMRAAAAGQFQRPSALVPGYCKKLEEITLWAMAPDPKNRCPDAKTLFKALEEYTQERGCTQQTVADYLRRLFAAEAPAEATDDADIVPEVSDISENVDFTPLPASTVQSSSSVASSPSALQLNASRQTAKSWVGRSVLIGFPLAAAVLGGVFAWQSSQTSSDVGVSMASLPHRGEVGEVRAAGTSAIDNVAQEQRAPQARPHADSPSNANYESLLKSAKAALAKGRYAEAAVFARRALAEQLNAPAALAVLQEATEAARRPPSPQPVGVSNKDGSLFIDSDPVAQVYLNGKLLGWSPQRLPKLPEGAYQVMARHSLYVPVTQEVRVRPGKATEVSLSLTDRIDVPVPVKVAHTNSEGTPDIPPPPPPPVEPPPHNVKPETVEETKRAVSPEPSAAEKTPPADPAPSKVPSSVPMPGMDCTDGTHIVRDTLQMWCANNEGVRNGRYIRLFASGKKAEEGEYRAGKKHGRWVEFYEQGGERSRVEWRKGVQSW
jgi:serine/threonine-protein kinase